VIRRVLVHTSMARNASRRRLRSIDERSESEIMFDGGLPSEIISICSRSRTRSRKRYASESVSQVSFAMSPVSMAARRRSRVFEDRAADSRP